MSGYESPQPEKEVAGGAVDDGTGDGGAMGGGGAEAPDMMAHEGGDATGGGSPGDMDAMGAENSPTPDDEAHLRDLR